MLISYWYDIRTMYVARNQLGERVAVNPPSPRIVTENIRAVIEVDESVTACPWTSEVKVVLSD